MLTCLRPRLDRLNADARRYLVGRTVLIERLSGDAIGVALHHERTIGERGQQIRRHPYIVAEQIALRQRAHLPWTSSRRPEHLAQVGDLEATAIRQFEHAI